MAYIIAVSNRMRVLFKIKTEVNPGLKILGFLPVMVAEHIRQYRTVIGEIAHLFGAARLFPGIRNDIRLVESFRYGQPIRCFAPKSRGAEDFRNLGSTIAYMLATPLLDGPSRGGAAVQHGGGR